MNSRTRKLTIVALLTAMCVVGANIKILGSIALDSFPAFLGSLLLGMGPGAFLGFFGHMLSALLSGFPNSLPVHLIIGVFMALCMVVYSYLHKKFRDRKILAAVIASVGGYIFNVPLPLLCLYPILGEAVYALFIPLTVSTVMNLVLSELVYVAIPEKYKKNIFTENGR